LARVERAGVECHPDHRARRAALGEVAQVVHRAHAARGVHRHRRQLDHVLDEHQVDALHLPLLVHRRDEQPGERQPGDLLDHVGDEAGSVVCQPRVVTRRSRTSAASTMAPG
jgi:hypothetical protein